MQSTTFTSQEVLYLVYCKNFCSYISYVACICWTRCWFWAGIPKDDTSCTSGWLWCVIWPCKSVLLGRFWRAWFCCCIEFVMLFVAGNILPPTMAPEDGGSVPAGMFPAVVVLGKGLKPLVLYTPLLPDTDSRPNSAKHLRACRDAASWEASRVCPEPWLT